MRKRYALIGAVALAILAIYIAAPIAPNDLGGTIGVKLVVQVHRSDGTTETYVKEGDPILQNLAVILARAFTSSSDTDTFTVTKLDGTTQSLCLTTNFELGEQGALIILGSGNTTPTINDYKIYNEIAEVAADADISVVDNDFNIVISGTYTANTTITITEVGLTVSYAACDNYSPYYALILRDVLATPVQLNAGDTVTVQYTIVLNNP